MGDGLAQSKNVTCVFVGDVGHDVIFALSLKHFSRISNRMIDKGLLLRYHSHDVYSLKLHKENDVDKCDNGKLVV